MSQMIAVGNKAPDFCLPDQAGVPVCLKDLLPKGWVVVFFYPKDHTPGCTTEACSFRDAYSDFRDAGAEVIGISGDGADSHQRFADSHRLPFRLLSDTDDSVRQAYGIPKTLGLLPGRATFVIDPSGIVQMAFSSQFNANAHIEKSLALLKQQRTSV